MPKTFEYVTNGFITNYAKKIIVHSQFAKKKLLDKNISTNVVHIPHYAKIEEVNNKSKMLAREKLGLSKDKIIISAFGHIHETKRIMPILQAIKQITSINTNIMLCLVGKPDIAIKSEMDSFIVQNNLEDKVIITGYIEIDTFESYIDATDICLNLRYPYNGESSGSLMRSLAKGKCTVLNDIGSFSEIPNNSCVKLPSPEELSNEQEVQLLVNALSELISNEQRIKTVGENARGYAERYLDIGEITNQYTGFLLANTINLNAEKISLLTKFIKNAGLSEKINIFELAKTIAYLKQY